MMTDSEDLFFKFHILSLIENIRKTGVTFKIVFKLSLKVGA